MNNLLISLWSESLKARRSKVMMLTAVGSLILPLIAGLFMIILKDPEQARSMGLISVKAQLTAGMADWPTFFQILTQGAAIGGGIIFALITAWVFGREYSDHTAKELLALPMPRAAIVIAKFILIAIWTLVLILMIFLVGLGIGTAVDIPGWSLDLVWNSFWTLLIIGVLSFMLMPFVALVASIGRGYLPPMGWAFLTIALAQVVAILGWGDWFPWAVPALISGMAGPSVEQTGVHSILLVFLAFLAGAAGTIAWWQSADQAV